MDSGIGSDIVLSCDMQGEAVVESRRADIADLLEADGGDGF